MTDADELLTDYPLLAVVLTVLVGAVGYVLPTALFGRPVEAVPTAVFAVGFTVLYLGLARFEDRIPDLDL